MALKLTEEEAAFAKQLFEIRQKIEQLLIEEVTHVDRLLAVMRGHGAKTAEGKDGITVERVQHDGYDHIIIRGYGRLPHEMRKVPGVDDPH